MSTKYLCDITSFTTNSDLLVSYLLNLITYWPDDTIMS